MTTSVDIILFCYNQEQYIEQALRSVYAQKLPKNVVARIIVADDGSSDNTLRIIKQLSSESPFPMAFLTEQPNLGISKNYKRSFASTQAEYVAILEGDDYWFPDHLFQHINFLNRHRRYSLSMNQFQFLQEGVGLQRVHWPFVVSYVPISLRQQIECGNQLGNLSSCVIRGKYLRVLPDSFYEYHFADWELGMCMAEFGPMAILRGVTSIYRVKASGQWAQLNEDERQLSLLTSINEMDAFFEYKYHDSFMIVRNRVERREPFSYSEFPVISLILLKIRSLAKFIKQFPSKLLGLLKGINAKRLNEKSE